MTPLSPKLSWELANPKWAASLNPLLANPVVGGNLLSGVIVKAGANVINHGLGVALQGYLVVGNNASATFWDTQATNPRPELTLQLQASAPATITLYVF